MIFSTTFEFGQPAFELSFSLVAYFNTSKSSHFPSYKQPRGMPVRRLGAGHDLTCEREYSGYEIANTPIQDPGIDRKV
jgi:hypothetical protein